MTTTINGVVWQIVRVHPYDNNIVNDDGTLTVGMTDTRCKTIFLSSLLYGRFLEKVLIHELTHAWIFSYGYYLSREQQEFICDFVASNGGDILSRADELICTGYFRVAL